MDNLVVLDNGELQLASDVKKTIYSIEKEIKNLTELRDKYKKALIQEIEDRGIINCNIKNELFTLTYKGASTRETIDSKRLREEKPEIYDEYCKIGNVASSISVRLKEQE
jgi:hypothetical protein